MKEAIVTAHYTIAAWPRTPAELVTALLDSTPAPVTRNSERREV